ncbi:MULTISPECIES: hypothetical protein [Ralstonia]|jgi:hypothetical protein|uniref:Uncharacterized protein n=2 Tax=Ralstonia TaxID=48736 RepID=A0AAD2C2J3_9RALS|nr:MULTISPECIES: hypothetical protein [Ralstonia]NMV39882.1 hypothetical protein [Ralstonia insidiosa]CAJ0808548.1 hypothetical protein R77560_04738 [Ralstonia sp. LMG 18095]
MFIVRYRDSKAVVDTLDTLVAAVTWLQGRALPGLFEIVGRHQEAN